MDVIVQLSRDAARVLQKRGPSTTETEEVRRVLQEIGVDLQPLHPESGDPTLDTYFYVRVPDEAAARRVLDAVRSCRAVTAAYLKPPEGPPS
ncbi:MAG TPA: hypothetical protein VE422_13935 [Terriglobia bacterium]|nr:hypothetical protein [Terriglobia bacterium]